MLSTLRCYHVVDDTTKALTLTLNPTLRLQSLTLTLGLQSLTLVSNPNTL